MQHQRKSKPKAGAKKKKKSVRENQVQKVMPVDSKEILNQSPHIPVTFRVHAEGIFIKRTCRGSCCLLFVIHEGDTSEDNVEDMSNANSVSSDNEEQIIGDNLLKHLKENSDVEEESSPAGSKLDPNTSCMTTITFTDGDLQLGSRPHNIPLYVLGYRLKHKIRHILLDCGSAVNLIPISTMR